MLLNRIMTSSLKMKTIKYNFNSFNNSYKKIFLKSESIINLSNGKRLLILKGNKIK